MDYNIITSADAPKIESTAGPVPATADDALDKLFKYIPSITVATYLAIQGIITQVHDPSVRKWVLVAVVVILLAGTYLFLTARKVRRVTQLAASLGAFVVWVFALGGPFQAFWGGYEAWMGSIALMLGAYLLAVWNPPPLPGQ